MKLRAKLMAIRDVCYAGGHRLKILFSDGTIQVIDFEPFLANAQHPEIRKYLSEKNFKKFLLHDGELMWGDFDLIFPIMDLYHNTIGGKAPVKHGLIERSRKV